MRSIIEKPGDREVRKVYLFDMITVDGYFEGKNHDLSWHNVDGEFNEFAIKQLHETGTLLFGRLTYRLMADYWPTQSALEDDPVVARLMNSTRKIVFSTTMENAEWNNTRLVKKNAADEVSALKKQQGKDIGILGSSRLAAGLISCGLIDELRFMVAPIALGSGTPVLSGLEQTVKLQLIESRVFKSGNVLLRYQNTQ